MAQTPVIVNSTVGAPTIEYLATEDKTAGDVVVVGDVVCVVKRDIDFSEDALGTVTDGRGDVDWLMPQDASIKTGGDALYWNATGDPVGGTAGSGAATTTANANLIGWVAPSQANGTNATAATDSYVRAIPNACRRTATIAGAVTATDITASDASLAIAGIAAAQGGAITITGGTSSTAANAGGAITLTGGTPGAEGVGGALTLTGGAGGSTSGAGGAVTFAAGAGTAGNANGGAMTILGGNAHGSGTDGVLGLGTSNTSAINVGAAGVVTYVNGSLRVSHTVTPVAAAGSAVADAGALADVVITHITSDGATKGVKLPAVLTAGVVRIVVNNSSTAAELYAESTGTINGAAADASMVIAASKGVLCISTAAKTWIAFDLPALASASS